MTRPYQSVSSVKLGQLCRRAYAYRYVQGLRRENPDWAQIEAWGKAWQKHCTPAQRSLALGTDGHAVVEDWYLGKPPAWRSYPGQVFLAGAHLLPHPDRCHTVRVEAPIGSVPLPPSDSEHAPSVAFDYGGVLWAGFRDLLVYAPGEFIRLGVDAPDNWLLIDHKSTASIASYAMSAAELRVDAQANLYAMATYVELDLTALPVRWVYYETKAKRQAKAVDATVQARQAERVLAPFVDLAHELNAIVDPDLAPKNPHACADYGGCEFHRKQGGPCDARVPLGRLVQARVKSKGTDTMALPSAVQAKIDALKNKGRAAPPPAEDPAETGADAPEAEAAAPAAKFKPRAKKAGAPATGSAAALLTELVGTLAEAEDEAAAATAKVAAAKAAIAEACAP